MLAFFKFSIKFLAIAALAIVVLRLVYPLPSLAGRTISTARQPTAETMLGQAILPVMAANFGKSGVTALAHGPDALAARISLANAAENTLDAQYYIWHNDPSGLLLLDALRRAAERGVRVRLLVDDNGTPHLDQELVALSAMENMEVRVFNPFTLRTPRLLSYLFDFPRLNRRMHNKSFTVDGIATIVGGRNIGDIYFAYGTEGRYFDLDVLAVGPAAMDVSENFDLFWASQSSYPSDRVVESDGTGQALLAKEVAAAKANPQTAIYLEALQSSHMVQQITVGDFALEWTRVQMVSDDPSKGLGPIEPEKLMITRLGGILGEVHSGIDLISAYFIPGDLLTGYLTGLAAKGRKIRTLTNSQEATDVLPVHAGYVPYRTRLLAGGVEVFELKSTQQKRSLNDQFGVLGASSTGLHAKTFTIDNARIFIGSFNFDPRSANLNCEMGFLIESEAISNMMTVLFDQKLRQAAYEVVRTAEGGEIWIERTPDGDETRFDAEPHTTSFSRAIVSIISWLPVEWML